MRLLLALAVGLLVALPASAQPTPAEVQKIMQRDFHPRGQATMERLTQDGVQRVCTETHDKPPADLAKALEADQVKTIAFPEGSLMGDWKRGEASVSRKGGSRLRFFSTQAVCGFSAPARAAMASNPSRSRSSHA